MRLLCNSLNSWTQKWSFVKPIQRSVSLKQDHVVASGRGLATLKDLQVNQILQNGFTRRLYSSDIKNRTSSYESISVNQVTKSYLSRRIQQASSLRRLYSTDNNNDDNIGNEEDTHYQMVDIHQHEELLQQYNLRVLETQNVLVIQPYHKRGDLGNKRNTDRDLMMLETLGLVETLEWHVADKMFLGIENFERAAFFGTGQLSMIKEAIDGLERPPAQTSNGDNKQPDSTQTKRPVFVSAIFVSTYRLSSKQRGIMEEVLEKPVLDRYNIVLQIFKRHARTKEARLQVELAELPYLRSRLVGDYEVELLSKHDRTKRKGEQYFDSQRDLLNRRERKVKAEIASMADQRAVLRKNRHRLHIPSVAVVGYTNCGKTSLIKALTGSSKLTPKNKLFATLDVTTHGAKLPCNMNIYFLDTVGFISDVPTELIASFQATLEDAVLADLLIHVRDVSHPDHVAQNETVNETLESLRIPRLLLETMITVGNKIDLINPIDWQSVKEDGMLPISVQKGYGLKQLVNMIENKLINGTGRKRTILRVKTGSEEFSWLMQHVAVYKSEADPDNPNYSFLHALLLDLEFNRFKKYFIRSQARG